MADITVYDPPGPDPMFMMIQRAATDPAFDMEKFQMLLTEYRNERETKARRLFNDAMAATQAEIGPILRDRVNTHLGNRYATLDAMLDVILPVASAHNLNVRFGSAPPSQPGWQCVTCVISLGDHTETMSLEAPVTMTGSQGGRTQMTAIQAVGSTTTYLKRYLISNAFALRTAEAGTVTDDDDGEASRDTKGTPRAEQQQRDARAAMTADTARADAKAAETEAIDHETYKAAFRRRLHATKTEAEIADLLAVPDIKRWLDGAPLRIKGDVDAMIEAKQRILKEAQPTTDPAEPTSPALAGLLARIADASQTMLDDMPTSPSFNEAMLGLSLPEQDRVDQAFKSRAEALKAQN